MYNLVLEVNKQIETISINLKKDDTEGSGSSSLFQENGCSYDKVIDDESLPVPVLKEKPSKFALLAHRLIKKPVILNVGGHRHEVKWDTLNSYPTSRLAKINNASVTKACSSSATPTPWSRGSSTSTDLLETSMLCWDFTGLESSTSQPGCVSRTTARSWST